MSPPKPPPEQLLQVAGSILHRMSAGTRATLIAELQRETKNREEAQEELNDVQRQNYALGDLLSEYEEHLSQQQAQHQAYVEEVQESREKIRKGKQREIAANEYTIILEQLCEDLENESTRAAAGSACREKDLKEELQAETARAEGLKQSLHIQDERARQIFEEQVQNLRAEHDTNEALDQITAEAGQHISRLTRSQRQSRHRVNRIRKLSATLAHQGEYNLAGRSHASQAKRRKQRCSSIRADSDICMEDFIDDPDLMDVEDVVTTGSDISTEDFIDSAGLMDVEDVVMQSPPPQMAARLRIQDILKWFLRRRKTRGNANLKSTHAIPKPESPARQINPLWVQYREFSAELSNDSSDSENSCIFPLLPRKKRTHGLNLDEESPKRRRFSAEAPELQPKMESLEIDKTKAKPKSRTRLLRVFRPRFPQGNPFKRNLTKKCRDPLQPLNLTPIRQSDIPPLLAAAEQRQRLDMRGRSLSLNDLPQLPTGQMPGMWPLDAPGDGDLVSLCQLAWRELFDWLLQLLWRQPGTVIVSVGLAALAWVWHCHRVQEDWMAANEIPYGIASGLRNARVSEIRWVESLVFSLTQWLDTDRSMLG